MNREPGYYWVRSGDDWEIAKWNGEYWRCFGGFANIYYSDRTFDEIDPTPIKRTNNE